MKELALSLSFLIFTCLVAAQPTIAWQKSYGGSGFDKPEDICLSNDGGYFMTGYVVTNDGDISGFHGSQDFWVVKINATGVIQWQKALGGSGEDYAFSVQSTMDGGCIVAGHTDSNDGDVTGNHGDFDYWLVKLSSAGDLQWQKTLGGSDADYATFAHQTTDGGYIVTGYSNSDDGDVTGNHAAYDVWVAKLNNVGTIIWQKSLGGNRNEQPYAVHQTTDGGFILACTTGSSNGDVTGYHGVNGGDAWVVKISSIGVIEWQKAYGGSNHEEAYDIHQTGDGGFIVSGQTNSNDGDVSGGHGSQDAWVMKLDATGNLQWQKVLGGSAEDQAYAIIQTNDGGYLMAAQTYSTNGDVTGNHGYGDAWVVKLTDTGAIQWKKAFGGTGLESAKSIRQTVNGAYIVVGRGDSNNGDVSGNHGGSDFWVFQLGTGTVGFTELLNTSQQKQLDIAPNPSSQMIRLEVATSEEAMVQVQVYDTFGRMVLQKPITNGGSIDVSTFPIGLYVVAASTASGKLLSTGKFQKQ